MPNPIKEALLGRGWAGKTISRAETVERLNPLIRQYMELNRSYRRAIQSLAESPVSEAFERLQKTARADVAKLSETIHSCGGTPYNGTDLDTEDVHLGTDPVELLSELKERETAFRDAVVHQRKNVEHQMRTRGVLEALRSNSEERLDFLNRLLDRTDNVT